MDERHCHARSGRAERVDLDQPEVVPFLPGLSRAVWSAIAGTVWRYAKRSAHIPFDTISASGSSPRASARLDAHYDDRGGAVRQLRRVARRDGARPGEGRGQIRQRAGVVCGRMPSSRSTRAVDPPRPVTSTPTISSDDRPDPVRSPPAREIGMSARGRGAGASWALRHARGSTELSARLGYART